MSAKPGASHYIPSLDGMRAIAVIFVCLSHVLGGPGTALDVGNAAVRVFFVLSGFLITTLLLNEWDQRHTINLGRFYFRRALRIFPAYYAYLAASAVAASLGRIELHRGDLLYGVTYTVNYHAPAASSFVQHAWSLAIEEQFYLLWPALLVLLGRRRGLQLAVLYICLAPVLRVMIHQSLPDLMKGTIRYRFETVADALAMGCVLAGYRERLWEIAWYRRLISSSWFWLFPAGALAIAAIPSNAFRAIVGISVLNVAIAAMLDHSMRMPSDIVGLVLNTRPARAIGVLSYSIYLWQQPFLATHRVVWWTRFPTSIVLLMAAALASYFLIERPFLALRQYVTSRLGRRAAVGAPTKAA